MEDLPDPTKKPRELRQEFGRKIGALIVEEFDRVGREHIQSSVNRLIDNYSLGFELGIDISIKVTDIGPMSGEDFEWPGLRPPTVSFGDED